MFEEYLFTRFIVYRYTINTRLVKKPVNQEITAGCNDESTKKMLTEKDKSSKKLNIYVLIRNSLLA